MQVKERFESRRGTCQGDVSSQKGCLGCVLVECGYEVGVEQWRVPRHRVGEWGGGTSEVTPGFDESMGKLPRASTELVYFGVWIGFEKLLFVIFVPLFDLLTISRTEMNCKRGAESHSLIHVSYMY